MLTRRRARVTSLQLQQRQPGHRLVTGPAGPPIRVGRGIDVAAQAVELALLVVGQAESRMWRIAEAVAGVRHRRHRAWPVAGRLPELGLVHQALAAVGNQVRLARHHSSSAAVHSAARARSKSCMHSRITAQ